MHTLLDVLHVVAAVFLIGPLEILPMTAMRALRAGEGSAVVALAKSTQIFAWASLAVLVFGFGVMGTTDERYGLGVTTPWIWISIVLYLIALGVTLFAVVPAMRAAGAVLGGGPADSTSVAPSAASSASSGSAASSASAASGDYRRIAMFSGIASLLLVAVVVLMVAKP